MPDISQSPNVFAEIDYSPSDAMILHWIRAILVLAATGLRVVLDTDLGDDIDDTWALSALLQA